MFQLKDCEAIVEPEESENFLNRKSWQIIVIFFLLCFDTVKYFHVAVLFRCILMLQIILKH